MVFVRRNIAVVHIPRGWLTQCLCLSQVDHSVCGIDTFESIEEGKVHVSFPSLFPDTGMGRSRARLSFSALVCAHTVP